MLRIERRDSLPGALLLTLLLAGALWLLLAAAACTPKVQVEAPKEPITINMNVKIEHEIRVKVDKELDTLIDDNEDLF